MAQEIEADGSPALFARGGDTAELRGECPREVLDVLDAVAFARDKTRIAIANEVLGEWAKKVRHEATLVQRVIQRNPALSDSAGVNPGGTHGR